MIVVHDALSDLGPGVFAGFEEAGVDEALAQGFVFEPGNLQVHQLYALLPQLSLERLIIGD